MLHGRSPWECSDEEELKKKMKEEEIEFREDLSEEMKELIKGCLER